MKQNGTIEVEVESAGVSIVTLRGEHDLLSAPEIAATLKAASIRRFVLVDLSECDFMDSSVISTLFRASNILHARGGQLSLVIPPDRHGTIRSLFELIGVTRLVPTHETRVAAIKHLESAEPAPSAPATRRLRDLSEVIDRGVPESGEQRRAS